MKADSSQDLRNIHEDKKEKEVQNAQLPQQEIRLGKFSEKNFKTSSVYENKLSSHEYVKGENLDYVYLQANFIDFKKFNKIKITVETHDQGWSTTETSFSFFDLRIIDSKGIIVAEKSRIIENYNEPEYKNKTFIIGKDDQFISENCSDENILQLIIRSQYPGWENHVKFGELSFE